MKGEEIIVRENLKDKIEVDNQSLQSWIFDRVKSFITGRVLELSQDNGHIALFCPQINKTAEVLPINLNNILSAPQSENEHAGYDTLIVFNSEPVFNYQTLIANCAGLLKEEGFLIIPLPASTALYNGHNSGFRRWKLHNMEYLYSLVRDHYRIVKARYFIVMTNQQQLLPQGMSKYRDRVTIFTKDQALSFFGSGLYAIVVARKK